MNCLVFFVESLVTRIFHLVKQELPLGCLIYMRFHRTNGGSDDIEHHFLSILSTHQTAIVLQPLQLLLLKFLA